MRSAPSRLMVRASIAPIVLFALLGAAPPHPVTSLPTYQAPAAPWASVDHAQELKACRDRIEQVRAASGKPELDRSPADPDKPLLIYAVDTRIDDCGVIIPVADPSDIRESPPPGRPQLVPAR